MATERKAPRAKGSGSMRETRRGVWELRVARPRDPVDGKARQLSETFHGTERQANVRLGELVGATSKEQGGSRATFGRLLDEWLRRKDAECSPTTMAKYRELVERVWRPAVGHVPLDELKAKHLQAVVDAEQRRGLSAPSVVRVHAVARGALRLGERLEWIDRSPAGRVVLPADSRDRPDDPTVEELLAVLHAATATDAGLGLVLRVAASFGVRRGELCGLRWRDIDLERAVATVVKNVVLVSDRQPGDPPLPRKPRRLVVKDTKTHRRRPLALDVDTVVLLHLLHNYVENTARAAGVRLHRDAFVFSRDATGRTPLHPEWVSAAFKRAVGAAKVNGEAVAPTIHLHQLRHLNASTMLAAGVPLAVASRRVGHARQSTTTDMYNDIIVGDDSGAALALGAMLLGVGPAVDASEVAPPKRGKPRQSSVGR